MFSVSLEVCPARACSLLSFPYMAGMTLVQKIDREVAKTWVRPVPMLGAKDTRKAGVRS